ncbi:MAG: amidohydrolase [Hydrogenophilaceae bacterium]|jgi:predicted TIM-barrel fold metal-dependent hydrolase|nr:amidohydrolase [Hydrogenophilaceae bacterium]
MPPADDKIWVNSADSHVWEPPTLWEENLPAHLKSRGPRVDRREKADVYIVDNEEVIFMKPDMLDAISPPGMMNLDLRMADLDQQGIWAEVVFASTGLWMTVMTDRELQRECTRVWNDWAHAELIKRSERYLPAAMLSSINVEDAAAEAERVAKLGFKVLAFPTTLVGGGEYNNPEFDKVWAVAQEAGLVISFHVGTGTKDLVVTRGPGGAIINYWETTVPAQRCVVHMVSSGALDRFPKLKVMTAEAGASWMPALGDRLDEAYRQHGRWMKPKLERLPSDILKAQVYSSFQHDETAVPTAIHSDYKNILWGSDYPHLEGTFPRTQEVLRELFKDVPDAVRHRVTLGAFEELFGVRMPAALAA